MCHNIHSTFIVKQAGGMWMPGMPHWVATPHGSPWPALSPCETALVKQVQTSQLQGKAEK